MSEIIPLRFGTHVVFSDRWAGRVSGFEVDEDWEVLNLLVSEGLIRTTTVKLPLDLATWTADRVTFAEATSAQAFGREVPPVAAPSRPLTSRTPVSIPGTRVAGALVDSTTRQAGELLLTRGGTSYRVTLDQVTFSGKELLVAARAEALERYYDDGQIDETVREAIARRRVLQLDEMRALDLTVSNGTVVAAGNVRTRQSLESIREISLTIPGVVAVSMEAVDDSALEFDVAQALYRAGVTRGAELYPRSALGEVTLFGYAHGAEAAAEGVRVASRVPGVRAVRDRIEVSTPQPMPAQGSA